jgi:exodeoxyribonuclease VII small subunit
VSVVQHDTAGEPDRGAGPTASDEAQALSYEQARDELADVVRRLEAGGLTLEESLDLWDRGEQLAIVCADWLEGARARLATAMASRGDRANVGQTRSAPRANGDDGTRTPF